MIGALLLVLAIATPAALVFAVVKLTESESARKGQSPASSVAATSARWFSIGYTGLLFAGALGCLLVATTTEYGAYSTPGCNLYDALIYGARCQGFFGSAAVSALLNFALLIAQLSAGLFASATFAPVALAIWVPPIYVIYLYTNRLIRTKHCTS